MPQRVLDKICKRLLEPQPVARDSQAAAVDLERAPRLVRAALESDGDGLEQLVDVRLLEAHRQHAAVEPGEQQEVLREPAEPVALFAHREQCSLELRVRTRALERE